MADTDYEAVRDWTFRNRAFHYTTSNVKCKIVDKSRKLNLWPATLGSTNIRFIIDLPRVR